MIIITIIVNHMLGRRSDRLPYIRADQFLLFLYNYLGILDTGRRQRSINLTTISTLLPANCFHQQTVRTVNEIDVCTTLGTD